MMIKRLLLVGIVCYAPLSLAYNFAAVADKHIIPGYQRLVETTQTLQQQAADYCNQTVPLDALQQNYKQAFLAWQGVQHLRFGPIQYISREHRFELWPDKRNSVSKHLLALMDDPLMQQDGVPDISQKSVAVQGFSALEYLLFNDKPADEKACKLINAIAMNLSVMSRNLLADWSAKDTAYRVDFVSAANGNDIYESEAELASQLFNSMNTQLEFMRTQKLERPLGENLKKSNGRRAEGWRSESALPALAANLASIHDFYRFSFSADIKNKKLSASIEQSFQQTKRSIDSISLPLNQAVSDSVQRKRLERLQNELAQLQQLLVTTISTELGLSLGFNSLDGD